jgi:hypothetical protein
MNACCAQRSTSSIIVALMSIVLGVVLIMYPKDAAKYSSWSAATPS